MPLGQNTKSNNECMAANGHARQAIYHIIRHMRYSFSEKINQEKKNLRQRHPIATYTSCFPYASDMTRFLEAIQHHTEFARSNAIKRQSVSQEFSRVHERTGSLWMEMEKGCLIVFHQAARHFGLGV